MDKRKEKLNCQLRLIAALKDFTGPMPADQFTQKEFFIVRLRTIGATLEEFKRDKLRELYDWLAARLARGSLSEADAAKLKESLALLVSGQDYNTVCAALSGSKELLLERLERVSPLSEAEEEKKGPGQFREPEADRLTGGAYARMGFDKLEKEIGAGRTEDEVLAQARERVGKYCSIGSMPLGMDNTMPYPTLTCIEAAAGACFRLLARIKR
jgi:hypothetical protein